MRTVPAALQAASLYSQTPSAVVEFLTISHADLPASLYLVNNPAAITHDGQEYSPFAFRVELPADKDGEIGDARLIIDAVDLSIITAIRSIQSRATVGIIVALADAPDTTEVDLGTFEWKDITYNATTVSGALTYEDRLDILVPGDTFTPVAVPGNF